MNEIDKIDLTILVAALKERIISVRFTKVDGSERTMNCTLDMALIPVDKLPKTETASVHNEEPESTVIRVFDVDLQEWRSFRKDNVLEWNIV